MPCVHVEVRWQKEVFKEVEVDLEQPPSVLKLQLYSLTGVPPERQKVMGVKGGLLKDDADWGKLGLKEGQRLTMMGTADKTPEAPMAAQTFVEDLPEDEQDTTGMSKYGAGLENMGNTCYMNSTVQCLYAVPELRTSLTDLAAPPGASLADPDRGLAVATRNLFQNLNRSAQPVPPMEFIMSLRRRYPQFGQQSREGFFMQQDAEECWSSLLTSLRDNLHDPAAGGESAIRRLFGLGLHTNLKCEESGESIEEDKLEYALRCNISMEVNHLGEGVALALKDDREKNSEALGRMAVYAGSSRISSLPPYLTVQMMRFYYKADVQQKAKILRKVTFPLVFDAYDYCTESLRGELRAPRLALKEVEDRRVGLSKKQKLEQQQGADSANSAAVAAANGAGSSAAAAAAPAPAAGDVDMAEAAGGAATAAAAAGAAAATAGASPKADDVDPAQYAGAMTGRYELIGVLTHKGRSADSGHYVAWVKQDDGQWIQYDDAQMIPRKEEEVLTLAGGGDWHMAYMLLYRTQRVPKEE